MRCLALLELNQLSLLVPGRGVAPPILLRLRLLFLLTPVTVQMLNNQERISPRPHLLLDTSKPAIRRVLLTTVLQLPVTVRAPNLERISRPHLLHLVTGHPAMPRLLPILVHLHLHLLLPRHSDRIVVGSGLSWVLSLGWW